MSSIFRTFYIDKIVIILKDYLNIFRNILLKPTLVVFVGAMLVNFLNYFFQLLMGRMLDPIEFGEMTFIFSLVVIMAVPSGTLSVFIARFISLNYFQNKIEFTKKFLKSMVFWVFLAGLILSMIFLLFSAKLSIFFNINKLPITIFSLFFVTSLISGFFLGILQGLQKFKAYSFFNLFSTISKIVLALIFLQFGFSVAGVIVALIMSSFVSYVYGYFQIKYSFRKNNLSVQSKDYDSVCWKDVCFSILFVFGATFLTNIFMSTDIIFSKHFFSKELAGQYSALSVVGKMIIYVAMAFATVMLPKISDFHIKKDKRSHKILRISLLLVFLGSLCLVILFSFFPKFIIGALLGGKYFFIVPYLGWFSLAMLFMALSLIFVQYFIAINEKRFLFPFSFVFAIQFLLLSFFNNNILQIIVCLIISSFLLFVSMLVFYLNSLKLFSKFFVQEKLAMKVLEIKS